MQTVAMMIQMVNESYRDPAIIRRAKWVAGFCNPREDIRTVISCVHQALLNWVRNSMRFVRDEDAAMYPPPLKMERLKHPVTWVERRIEEGEDVYGDCASMAVYLASLLKGIGHTPRFKVVGRGDYFHHVFVLCGGEELDPTMGYGEAPKNPKRVVTVDI